MLNVEVLTRSQQIKKVILDMIQEEDFTSEKLPPEDELAKMLGVSLATVREALTILTREGIITKKHGSGNYVHKSPLQAKMRIDLLIDFIDLLEDDGYKVDWLQSGYSIKQVDEATASKLKIAVGEEVITFEGRYYANGELAIFSVAQIPNKFILKPFPEEMREKNLPSIARKYCQQELVHAIVEMGQCVAGKKERELFYLMENTALMVWEEVFYNLQDQPFSYNRIFFNPNIMKIRFLSKWM